jgi:hypothetical protein
MVSDPVGEPLYFFIRNGKNGLPIYRCLCGTNSVEGGVHNPIHRKFGALNASVQLADSLLADHRHHYNTDVGMANYHGVQYKGHYDPWVVYRIDQLWETIIWSKPPPKLILVGKLFEPIKLCSN